jgi:hypothetical protein
MQEPLESLASFTMPFQLSHHLQHVFNQQRALRILFAKPRISGLATLDLS